VAGSDNIPPELLKHGGRTLKQKLYKLIRWEDDIRNDMKKLKIKNWTSCIQDHNNWKLYVEKTKTFND
jgi:hypothetical protein